MALKISERVRQLREKEGLTVQQLAERARVAQALVEQVEAGMVHESRKLTRIARAFGISVEDLMAGCEPPPPRQEIVLHCSFCGNSQYEVLKLIASGADKTTITCICDACVLLCFEILLEDGTTRLCLESIRERQQTRGDS